MTCIHLKTLYRLCEENELKISSADLVHFVCRECGEKEVCPSLLLDEYEYEAARQQQGGKGADGEA